MATDDHSIVAKKLVDTNTALVAQVKSQVETHAQLANTQGTKSPKPPRATITRESVPIDPNGYCWPHGFKVHMGHRSITCCSMLQGHRDDATRTITLNNKMCNIPKY